MEQQELKEVLVKRFSLGELRSLCFDMGISWEDVGGMGETLSGRAMSIVQYCHRHSRLNDLINAVQNERGVKVAMPTFQKPEQTNNKTLQAALEALDEAEEAIRKARREILRSM